MVARKRKSYPKELYPNLGFRDKNDKYGYQTLIIWGHELKEEELVTQKVKDFVRGDFRESI